MPNTEKPQGKTEQKKNAVGPGKEKKKMPTPKAGDAPKDKKEDKKVEEKDKKKVITKPKVQKTSAIVDAKSIPISNKTGKGICKFIKGKSIEKAIADLEQVILLKKPVPLTGEIPHRHGKGISSGRFPINASKEFIVLLKGLRGNVAVNELQDPVIISEAIINKAQRPFGKFGRVKRKRAHVKLIARSKLNKKKSSEEKK